MSLSSELLPAGALLEGKFRIVGLLGQGGMGTVYEIEHEITKHRRALKLLHRDLQQRPLLVERFLREASAAGRIGDAHIVEVFDAGTLATGEPYVVLELLSGETLAAMLVREKQLDLTSLVDIVVQACDGVAAAHAAGIIHRDLKPENLFLTKHGGRERFVKILDFGVSKFDRELTGGLALTDAGAALGTPLYMPPEQARGEDDIDVRADVYALGVILYECAAGEPPFLAQSLPELSILIHEGRAVPLHERRPDLPRAFTDVVASAMAVDRARRLPTAQALARALRTLPDLPGFADTAFGLPPTMASAAPPPPRGASVTPPATSSVHAERGASSGRRPFVVVLGVVVAAIAAGVLATFVALRAPRRAAESSPPDPVGAGQATLPSEPPPLPSAPPVPRTSPSESEVASAAASEPASAQAPPSAISPQRPQVAPSATTKAARAGLAAELPK